MRNLVVYYSFTGNTRMVAERAARDLDTDTAEVCASCYQFGGFRFLRPAFDSWRGRLPVIDVSGRRPEDYDFMLIMAPVWAGHAATPMRAYLAQNRGKLQTCRLHSHVRGLMSAARVRGDGGPRWA